MVDKYVVGNTTMLSFEAPIPIVEVQETELKIGGAGIISENVSSLGAKTFMVGLVGNDEAGHWLVNKIKKIGADSKCVITCKSARTMLRTRLIANNHQIARFDEPSIKINTAFEKDIIKKLKLLIPRVDCIIVCDYGKGTINKKIIQFIAENATKHSKKVIVSPIENHLNYTDSSFVYRIKVNDARKLLGIKNMNVTDHIICKKLESLLRSKRIILTKGEMGITTYDGDTITDIPSTHHLARDITSVGEVLVSAFAVAYAAGVSFEESCKIGNVAAGSVVEKIGAKQITKKELEKALSEYNEWGLQK